MIDYIQVENHNDDSIPQFSVKKLIEFIYKRGATPITIRELMDKLDVSDDYKRPFTSFLKELVASGILVKVKGKRFARCTKSNWVTGVIRLLPTGAGIVTNRETNRKVFIHQRNTAAAITEDEVIVSLNRRGRRSNRDSLEEGEVIGVISRNRSTVVGTVFKLYTDYFVEPQNTDIGRDIYIQNPQVAKLGDRVVVELHSIDRNRAYPSGRITEVIGPVDEPTLDTISVIKAFDLPTRFPDDVIKQAESVTITAVDLDGRLDLQDKFIFTIDPVTARDFDDALSLEKVKNGQWLLGVHIADVSHFISVDSALDKEARERGNSVYLPDTVIPMLPEHLSNGICSLKPDASRLTISALITLDNNATPLSVEFYKSVIRSGCRLNYDQVQSILDLPSSAAALDAVLDKQAVSTLKQLNEMARMLRKRRFECGALNMAIPEVQFSIGPDGRINGITPVQNNESHQLVEECMLLANELVCKELTRKCIPHLYRIHDVPDPERLQELGELLDIAGLRAGDLTVRKNLCKFVSSIADSPYAHAWNTAVLRCMRKAEYSEKGIGHYGLAKQHYTHFTSPIRRYSDLVVHRILKAYVGRQKQIYTKSLLSEIAKRCSERELVAGRAERDVKDLKRLRYFDEQIESGKLIVYDAVVVDTQKHGLFIDIPEVQAYGMIHKSMLGTKIYFDAGKKQFFNRSRNAKLFKIGSSLKVVIARVDFKKRYLDFAPA